MLRSVVLLLAVLALAACVVEGLPVGALHRSTTLSPLAATAGAAGKCPGICQAPGAKCAAGKIMRGLCPGALVCCSGARGAAAPAAGGPLNADSPLKNLLKEYAQPGFCSESGPILPHKGRDIRWHDLTTAQQSNAVLIVQEAKKQGVTSINAVAYILGTATWESHLLPIPEHNGPNLKYAPYYGRGFVQLTWLANYQKFSQLLQQERGRTVDLAANPEKALDPAIAAFVIVHGMRTGAFATAKLDDYFAPEKFKQWGGKTCEYARYIVRRTKTAHCGGSARQLPSRSVSHHLLLLSPLFLQVNNNDQSSTVANIAIAWIPLAEKMLASPTSSPI
jgi:hypothetical protein